MSWVFYQFVYHFLKDVRPRLKGTKLKAFQHLTKKERRILVVGDLHCPFDLDGYLKFVIDTYEKWNCNQIIQIGDCLDNHYSSFHPTDADGYGGGEELDRAIARLSRYRDAFAKICDKPVDILVGNHDRLIMRRAFDSDIPARWIKSYNEVLGTNWNWVDRIVYKVISIHNFIPNIWLAETSLFLGCRLDAVLMPQLMPQHTQRTLRNKR